MINYNTAIEILINSAKTRSLPHEVVRLELALGRFLAKSVVSSEFVPSFNNSAMDGFAVQSHLTAKASNEQPIIFQALGCIAAGDQEPVAPSGQAPDRVCWEIMTGAPMPGGDFDAVVKIEDVEVIRSTNGEAREIKLFAPIGAGINARKRGEDFQTGTEVAAAGTQIQPEHIMAFASLGINQVPVVSRPSIAIISTGRELIEHDDVSNDSRLGPKNKMLRNSTAPYLLAALPKFGAQCTYYGTIADDPQHFSDLVAKVLKTNPDVILTTGAVSMGKYDFVRTALESLGAKTIFHKVAIRPGKPLLFSEIINGGTVFFGVPGNPVSTSVGVRFFLAPYLRALMGLPREKPILAKLTKSTNKPAELRCFFKARTRLSPSGLTVEALQGQASFMISPLLKANAWVVLKENPNDPDPKALANDLVPENSEVEIFPLYPAPYPDESEPLSEAMNNSFSETNKGTCCQ